MHISIQQNGLLHFIQPKFHFGETVMVENRAATIFGMSWIEEDEEWLYEVIYTDTALAAVMAYDESNMNPIVEVT